MKKITMIILITVAVLSITAGVSALLIGRAAPENAFGFSFSTDVEVRDGEVFPDGENAPAVPFKLEQSGDYTLHISWGPKEHEMPGFLTLFLLKDAQGKVLFYTCADQMFGDLDIGILKAGDYTAEYRFFTDEAKLRQTLIGLGEDISSENRGSFYGFDRFGQEGAWSCDLVIELEGDAPVGQQRTLFAVIFLGVGAGALIAAIAFLLTKKDRESKNSYDERQEMFRGRAFKYAFFTMLAYYMIMMMLEAGRVKLPMDQAVKLFMGIAVALIPFVCYSIWKDAYFGLNDTKGRILMLTVITVVELIIGIGNVLLGTVFVDGKLTFEGMSLVMGIDLCIALMTALVKKIKDRKGDAA